MIRQGWLETTVLVACGLMLAGCATGSAGKQNAGSEGAEAAVKDGKKGEGGEVETEHLEADPMLVKARADGKGSESVDSKDVFEKAYNAYSARRYGEAAEHYKVIVEYFPDSRFYRPALYNGGLAFEKMKRWSEAASFYRKIVEEFSDQEDTLDAYYRLAEVYKHLGKHEKIVELMTQAMLRDGLTNFDRIEAHIRRADALLELGKLSDAEQSFKSALKLNREAPANERLPNSNRYIVQSYFGLGRVYHRKAKEIPLTLPPESMEGDLEEKANLVLQAQVNYLDALRQHHPHWSVASGYMIGQLYEDFYSDIYSAEIPEDLTEEQVRMYFDELRGRIEPLMKRAIKVYKKNLSLSKRIGENPENNHWVQATRRSLNRMQTFLNDPQVQRRAEKLALEGRDFRKVWKPYEMAADTVDRAITKGMKEAGRAISEKNEDTKQKDGPES